MTERRKMSAGSVVRILMAAVAVIALAALYVASLAVAYSGAQSAVQAIQVWSEFTATAVVIIGITIALYGATFVTYPQARGHSSVPMVPAPADQTEEPRRQSDDLIAET